MRKLVVIGDPVKKSMSPVMHNAALKEMNLEDEFVYEKIRVEIGELESFLQDLKQGDYYGANVTIPHKVEVIKYMDRLTEASEKIGAVNTIYKEDGMLVGDNTDSIGFIRSLVDEDIDVDGRSVMVIGAGGAARAVVYALSKEGADRIVIANRTKENAVKLIKEFADSKTCIHAVSLDEIEGEIDILVNTTPLGMAGKFENKSPISVDRIPPNKTAVDIVYNPPKTKFLEGAEERGCETVSGIGMLVHQGAAALERWTGKEVPVDVMKQALIRKIKKNIALIGFMGTGKSTVGEYLAERLDRRFIEVDEFIEEEADKNIDEIFSEDGEKHFRALESKMIKKVCEMEKTVISCGGGAVIHERNADVLRKNTNVVLLTASTEEILRRVGDDDSRPLLRYQDKAKRIKELMDDRKELYDICAHITIDTSGKGVDDVVEEITRRTAG
ncbi:MAG: shikimate dehydrogenase [Thermoplasmata archaeon]